MTVGEMVKFMRLCIIITRFQFLLRQYLWSQTAPPKSVPAFKLGQLTGMAQNRFDMIWRCLRWSHQPKHREEGMTHAQYRWLLVDDFIDCFNNHWSDNFFQGQQFVLTSQWLGGTVMVAIGSIEVFPTILPLTESHIIVWKFRTRLVVNLVSWLGWS